MKASDVNSSNGKVLSAPLAGRAARNQGEAKALVVGAELVAELPDRMQPILPLLDQQNKNPDAMNGVVDKRNNVKLSAGGGQSGVAEGEATLRNTPP